MERDIAHLFGYRRPTNFNSHAHVERDPMLPSSILCRFISTHTLTWSVTGFATGTNYQEAISTHTLTWSVTTPPNVSTKYWNISTHTLTWSVTYQHLTLLSQFDISTHTLTWSVTE